MPFPHPTGLYGLATDRDFDGHSTDNPNNAAPRESCWRDAHQGKYTTGVQEET